MGDSMGARKKLMGGVACGGVCVFLSFPLLSEMISVLTPRIEAALDQMNYAEISQMHAAMESNNDKAVWQMLAAKDILILVENDPMLTLLYRDDLQWGDVMLGVPTKPRKAEYKEVDPDAHWTMPALRLRKDIWENFPVNVVPMQSKDNRECYAIQWHNKKFQEARESCEHGWEYMDFEDDTYRRLMKSLSASRFWTVEEAAGDHDLCTIAMNFQDEKPLQTKTFTLPSNKETDSDNESTNTSSWEHVGKKASAPTPAYPILRRLNDIKNHFPVIWNEVNGCKTTTYAVEVFGKRVKEQGLNMAKVKTDLLVALKASRSWTVLPATNERHVCLLQMNHL